MRRGNWMNSWQLYIHDYTNISTDDYEGKAFMFWNIPYSEYMFIRLRYKSPDSNVTLYIYKNDSEWKTFTLSSCSDYTVWTSEELEHGVGYGDRVEFKFKFAVAEGTAYIDLFEVWIR